MTRHVLLIDHGTRLMELAPGSIAHAAEHDLKVREGKRGVAPTVEASTRYAFHRKHVKQAASPADLLARAIMEPGLGKASAKVNTRIVYGDVEKLKLALEIARERYG